MVHIIKEENTVENLVYKSDRCLLLNGDCFEVMKEFPNDYIDFVLTDPPYGINLTPQRKNGKFKNTKVENDNSLEWLPGFVNEVYRVSKNVVCVFCGWQNIDKFKIEFERKFIIKNVLVWNKDWFGMGNNYRPNYELIYFRLLYGIWIDGRCGSKYKSTLYRY